MDPFNPYAPPEVPLDSPVGSASDIESVSYDELRLYVGENIRYYNQNWPMTLSGSVYSTHFGFNWAAFFFSLYWLLYRKMYRRSLILGGVLLAKEIAEGVAVGLGVASFQSTTLAGRLAQLIIAVVCGWRANAWYLRHCQYQISKLRDQAAAEGLGPDGLYARLGERGGTNGLLVFLILVIILGLNIGALNYLLPNG